MADKHKKPQYPSAGFNLNIKSVKPQFGFTDQILHLNTPASAMWLSPVQLDIRKFGNDQILRVLGKVIDPNERKNYLLQTPPEIPDVSLKMGLYTDYSPDFFTRQEQVSVGVKGYGFKSNGNIFIQATAEHPQSNYYTGFQIVTSPGDIPLVVLHKKFTNISFTPQLGVDLQTGLLSPATKINFDHSVLKSINLQINNLTFDWKKRFADSSTVMFEFVLP